MQRNEHLRRQRIGRNWRQQDVADKLGTTVTTIQRWERGHQQPSAYYRVKLCTLFGLGAQELGLVETFASPLESTSVGQAEGAPSEEISLWTVPYARNPHFTGRDDLLQQLGQLFAAEKPGQPMSIHQAALTQTQAITGLGGIGKTQIAIEYAYRARMQGRYHHTIWISAASEETILTSFLELARLFMPTLVEQEGTNQRTIVATLLHWLEQCMQPWLLIFDNADDLSLVQPYLPRWGNGCILLTSRAHAVGAFASSLEVDSMGVMEATHLLLRRAHRFSTNSPEELDEAIMLVNALAQFPLAIDQAGAYIEETGCTLSTYLQLYQRYRHELLARRGGQATGYPESVVTTWSLSFALVERTNPAAAELLQLCAFLAPDHIPEELLTEGAPHWPLALREAVTNLLSFNQMLETLLAFSLVKRLSEDRMLSLHRLVQIVQMERMEAEAHYTWAQRLVCAMDALFPQDTQDVATWPRCQRYLEQVEACDELIQRHHLLLPEAADLLDRAGTYVREHMWYTQAEPLYRRALAIREQYLGPEHPDTATILHNLAILQRDTGNFVEAESLYQRALTIREQHLGPEHPSLADCLGGLAAVYQNQGKIVQAEALALHALHIHEQHLGPFHPSTADDLNTLAILYRDQGKLAEAGPLFLRAISIREQSFASTHLCLVETLYEFALLLHVQGHLNEARPLYERALDARIHILGATHPLTITVHERLIALLQTMGGAEEAAQLDETQRRSVGLLREITLDSSRSIEQNTAMASAWRSVLPVCPQCHQREEIIKSGKNRSGSQRFRCRVCQSYFTPQPSIREPDHARKAEALALAEQGMSHRHIARQLGVHHQTVGAWISRHDAHGGE